MSLAMRTGVNCLISFFWYSVICNVEPLYLFDLLTILHLYARG